MSEGEALETNGSVVTTADLFPWWLVLIEGIAAIVIGVLMFLAPQATLELVIQLFALFWVVGGVLKVVSTFTDPMDRGLKLLMGGVGILAGIAVIRHPIWLAVGLTAMLVVILGGVGVIIGLISLFMAFRGGGWSAAILGVLSLLFGILIFLNPLVTGIAWVYLYASVSVVGGMIAVARALKMRKGPEVVASPAEPVEAGQPAEPEPT